MIPSLLQGTGALPLGRFSATWAEVEQAFVDDSAFQSSARRRMIWAHLEDALAELRKIAPVRYLWIGGSFTTSKLDPDDVDVVFFVEDVDIDAVRQSGDVSAQLLLLAFQTGQLKQFGLAVDAFVCPVHVTPQPHTGVLDAYGAYANTRGYWDDFWQRMRTGPKHLAPTRPDALPQRGYVEVMVDGF